MAFYSLENMLGQNGYVLLGKGVYLFEEITELGTSGLSGYYAVLEGFSNGKQIKVGIFGKRGLIQHRLPKGSVILYMDRR